jgi:hypothetical protein
MNDDEMKKGEIVSSGYGDLISTYCVGTPLSPPLLLLITYHNPA